MSRSLTDAHGHVYRNPMRGVINRILQLLALYSPGAWSLRVWLHRKRGVQIGDNVMIGTGVLLETEHPEYVTIGDGSEIGIRTVVIAHFRTQRGVTIGKNVFIGPMVCIMPGVTIGDGAVVAAGSIVTRNVAAATMVRGNPAEPIATLGTHLTEGSDYRKFLFSMKPIRKETAGDEPS